jgi:hypothetical protein
LNCLKTVISQSSNKNNLYLIHFSRIWQAS